MRSVDVDAAATHSLYVCIVCVRLAVLMNVHSPRQLHTALVSMLHRSFPLVAQQDGDTSCALSLNICDMSEQCAHVHCDQLRCLLLIPFVAALPDNSFAGFARQLLCRLCPTAFFDSSFAGFVRQLSLTAPLPALSDSCSLTASLPALNASSFPFILQGQSLTPTLPVFRGQIGCCMDREHGPKQPIRRQ